MKRVETPYFKLSKFLGFAFGIPFTILGYFWYLYDASEAFLINGSIWIICSILLALKGIYRNYQLKKLIENSDSYECSIIQILPLDLIRIGHYITARLECTYENNGVSNKVLSETYLIPPFCKLEDLYTIVYVCKQNRKKYRVITFSKK